jgi:hypothetical protein
LIEQKVRRLITRNLAALADIVREVLRDPSWDVTFQGPGAAPFDVTFSDCHNHDLIQPPLYRGLGDLAARLPADHRHHHSRIPNTASPAVEDAA